MNVCARMIAGGWVAVPVALAVLTSPSAAQHPIPESQRWATITHAGNAPFMITNPGDPPLPRGSVNHVYQISRTEVTASEWFEFVLAYAPHINPAAAVSSSFTSDRVIGQRFPSGEVTYTMQPGAGNLPVRFGWRYAARYVNWLHNGKALAREAFESGSYETATFTQNPDGSYNDQRTRSPGAQYFIPTLDEWAKAAYWDPNKNGPGQPGYWQFPTTSDTHPIPGVPSVGQTNYSILQTFDVASYPSVHSPWGLLDMSGGVTEWTETATPNGSSRHKKGSNAFSPFDFGGILPPGFVDGIDYEPASSAVIGDAGLRIARVIPAPGSGVPIIGVVVIASIRRRRFA